MEHLERADELLTERVLEGHPASVQHARNHRVVGAHLAEQFPVAARATGIALTFGLAAELVGGMVPRAGRRWADGRESPG